MLKNKKIIIGFKKALFLVLLASGNLIGAEQAFILGNIQEWCGVAFKLKSMGL